MLSRFDYETEMENLDSYKVLKEKRLEIVPQLTWIFCDLFTAAKRRIRKRQLLRNPGHTTISHNIYNLIYWEWLRAIRDCDLPTFGRSIEVCRDKRGVLSTSTIRFINKGTLK